MTTYRHFPQALFGLALILLTACAEQDGSSSAQLEAHSRNLVPADSQLAELYNRSCRSCHTIAGTGAPLTGDTAAWDERMSKGMGILVDNVVSGFGGMPPFGMCMDCDADQFEALINFMARGQ